MTKFARCHRCRLNRDWRIKNTRQSQPGGVDMVGLRFDNRPELSDAENIALHDLWFHTDEFGLRLSDINNTINVSGNLDEAIRRRG